MVEAASEAVNTKWIPIGTVCGEGHVRQVAVSPCGLSSQSDCSVDWSPDFLLLWYRMGSYISLAKTCLVWPYSSGNIILSCFCAMVVGMRWFWVCAVWYGCASLIIPVSRSWFMRIHAVFSVCSYNPTMVYHCSTVKMTDSSDLN